MKKRSRFSVIIKLFFLFFVNAMIFFYAMFQGGFVSWFLFYSVLFVSLLSLSVLLVPLRRLDVKRKVTPKAIRANDTVNVTITVSKRFFHPFCFIRIKDVIPLGLESYEEQGALFFFSFQKTIVYEYTISNIGRGEHPFRFVEVVIGDLFGFFERAKLIEVKSVLVVFPLYFPLEDWNVHVSGGQEKGLSFARSFEEQLSFSEVREYIPGDRVASIDWKHSARANQLMTKQFETFKGETTCLLLNLFLEGKSTEVFEQEIVLCASLANYFYEKGISLRFAFMDEQVNVFEESSNLEHYQSIYYYLAKVEAKGHPFPNYEGIEKDFRGYTNVIVTASISSSFVQFVKTLRFYSNHVVVCFVQSALSELEQKTVLHLRKHGVSVYEFSDHFFHASR